VEENQPREQINLSGTLKAKYESFIQQNGGQDDMAVNAGVQEGPEDAPVEV
jgi:hypothetical protein